MMNGAKKVPRGIRNNNPMNIRKGNKWKGERFPQTDKAFEEFESMEYGIRAGFKILRNYMRGIGAGAFKFDTIRLIVRRWAPPSENATSKYVEFVSKSSGIPADRHLDFKDKDSMVRVVDAMIRYECGQSVDTQLIRSAYDLV